MSSSVSAALEMTGTITTCLFLCESEILCVHVHVHVHVHMCACDPRPHRYFFVCTRVRIIITTSSLLLCVYACVCDPSLHHLRERALGSQIMVNRMHTAH